MSTGNTVVFLMSAILLGGGAIGIGCSALSLGWMGHEVGDWRFVGAFGIAFGVVTAGWAGALLNGMVADLRESAQRLGGLR